MSQRAKAKLKHRVVMIHQNLDTHEEVKVSISHWMTPGEAEVYSDKEAQRVANDPRRYVLIESNQPLKCERLC